MVDTACAVITPGHAKAPTTPTDINTFHCTYGHTHEGLLKKTTEQQGVKLSGNSTSAGVFNDEGSTEALRQVDAHQSRYSLPLPRPRSN